MRYPLHHIIVGLLFLGMTKVHATPYDLSNEGGGKDTIGVWVPADSVPPHINLLVRLTRLEKQQMVRVVDSLLDADYVHPSILVSLSHMSERYSEEPPAVPVAAAYMPYPAHDIYGSWDTHEVNPYDKTLSANDTTVLLVLKSDTQEFVQPVVGVITSRYGFRDGRHHNGVDIDLQVWDKVYAAFDGVVRIAHADGGYGRLVVIRHYNGLETFYAHLHRYKVSEGDTVKAGQVIGLGGSSGRSTGSHLHFEMRYKGKPVNPMHMIALKEQKLISDSVVLYNNGRTYSAYPKGVVYHTIERGDCLYNIARRYGTTISHICEMNGIRRNSTLRVGRKLMVSGS
ncbi:MAG: peptidoglycan DD-metalloendopeptidase family protein [Flavobacteriales bacterium]|nr:peptidoglycan DD-metalloendopeptidase family protein [Flavobacteriales bacterium]